MKNAMRNMTRSIETGLGFEGTVEALRKALGEEHLQVLAELPFEERLEEASGIRWSKYRVLVVWSPMDAPHVVLSGREAGLFMPFNIVVKETAADSTVITALTHDLWDTPNQNGELRLLLRELDLKVGQVLLSVEDEFCAEAALPVDARTPNVNCQAA